MVGGRGSSIQGKFTTVSRRSTLTKNSFDWSVPTVYGPKDSYLLLFVETHVTFGMFTDVPTIKTSESQKSGEVREHVSFNVRGEKKTVKKVTHLENRVPLSGPPSSGTSVGTLGHSSPPSLQPAKNKDRPCSLAVCICID